MCGIFACLNYNVKRERSYILQVLFMAFPPHSRLSPGRQHRVPRHIRLPRNSLLIMLSSEVDATDLNLEESFLTHKRIAHAWWVTHGEPAPRSSHPQSSGDTTVTFSQVVLEVMRHLEGAYALIFKSRHYPNELIACKCGSPLLLGVKELTEESTKGSLFHDDKYPSQNGNPGELFLSNDANALVEHTRKVLVIEDGEVVHLKDGGVSILKFDGDKGKCGVLSRPASVQRALSVLEMENKIHEQPESLTTTMRGRLIRGGTCKAKTVLLGGLKDHLKTIRRSWRIVFIGCGMSYNAALAARPIWEEVSGIPVTREIASDLLDRQGPLYREDTAAFVSQSGIIYTVGSAIARNTHCGVHINAGAEIGVASTKAYTSQTVVMAMLALAIGGDAISNEVRREAIIDCLFELPNKVREVLKLDQEMKYLAKLLIAEQSLLMFGRGCNYATALEGSLKVKEVALMHSEGILDGEMKHGPLALVDESLPIVVIVTHDACFSKQQSVIQQFHARKGRLIVMCPRGDAAAMSLGVACRVIEVPQAEDCLQPVVNIVPLQVQSTSNSFLCLPRCSIFFFLLY
ncbi:hypothetical protein EUGRSUZ_H01633 [Eucalyptus grandis]|uniref:Uncharacterized protein n=2 Tax=Eucalyptus grandis TaxID=71139 RepID=A0ACC3JQU1_EUCGR|nr:hypothetical protein EUGRSUZ_H01633 [Eucalyptus grandis]